MNDNLYWHDLVSRASRFIFTRFSVLARLTIALVALAIGSHSEGAPQTAMGGEAASPDRIATSVNVEQFLLAEIRDDERRNQITAVRDKIFALQSTLVRLASGLPVQFVVEYSTVDLPNPLPDQYDSGRAASSHAAKVEKRLDVLGHLKVHSQLARTRAEESIASGSRFDAFKSGHAPALPLGVSLIRSHMTSPTATYEISSVNGLFELARNGQVTLVRQVFDAMHLGTSSPILVRQDLLGSVSALGNGKSVVVIEPKGVASAQASEFGDCSAQSPTHCNLLTPKLGLTYFPDIDLDHATNVAAITAIMAPAAKIISVQMTVNWNLDDILDWVASNSTTYDIVAINMSYCTVVLLAATCATDAFPANQKFVSLRALGVLPVAGSGNQGWLDKLTHPASDPAVLAVAATYTAEFSGFVQTYLPPLPPEFAECSETILTDKATCFSNMTSKVAVFAPGHYITAGGVTSTGTSQAAPHVSGAVAALSSLYSSETISQIEQRIVNRGPNVTKNGITRKRIDLFAAASNDVTISSSFNGSFSPNVVIAATVYGREKPEDAQLIGPGPWNVSTTAAGSLVRWYALNVPVTFTAPASDPAGGSFVRWDGGCTGMSATNRTCTISSVESSKGIIAVYLSPVAPPTGTTYQISVSKSGAGTVVSSGGAISCGTTCTATIAASSALSLTATAASGSVFTGWANCPSPNLNVCSFSVTAAQTVTANFVPAVTLTVAKIGTGLVTSALDAINCGAKCSAVLASGTSVTLTASNVAGSGYAFSSWSNCPVAPSGATCGPFIISANQSVTATFAPSTTQCVFSASPTPSTVAVGSGGTGYSVTLSSAVGCAVTVSNSNTSACVTNVASTIPGTGSTVLSVVVNSTTSARSCMIGVTGLSGSYVFNQSAPTVGTAYTIAQQVATNGTVGNSSGGIVGSLVCPTGGAVAGAVCSVSATANGGYAFSGWTESGTTVSASASYSFTVIGNRTLTANFVSSVSYVSYAVDVSGPLEGRVKINNSWYVRPVTGATSALLQVGTYYIASCATTPNWQLTSVYGSPFTAVASPPGLVQCQYQQTVPYLSLAQSSQPRFAAGYYNSMARTSDGKVYTWGIGQSGALGNGGGAAANSSALPVQSGSLTTVAGVYSSQQQLTQRALLTDGTVMSWGGGGTPGLGNGSGVGGSSALPVATTDFGASIRKIVGRDDVYILRTDGAVSKFSNGVTSPVNVPPNVVDIAARSSGVHALDAQGRVWALTFGYDSDTSNQGLQTGVTNYSSSDNTQANYTNSVPMLLPGLTRIVALAESGDNSFALRDDGTVWTWGPGGDALGSAAYPRTTNPFYEPATIPGLPSVKAIVGGGGFVLALDTSGNVWTWGSNSAGQLGRTAGASSAIAGQVTGLSGVMEIAAGRAHAMALKTDGTLWAWGENAYGKLGDGTMTNSVTPVQVKCPSGYDGYMNLLSGGCVPRATNTLTVNAFIGSAGIPVGTRVLVNGLPVTPPYQATLSANSTVALDITAPTGYAGGGWAGDLNTRTTAAIQLNLPMNRDWSLTPYVYLCGYSRNGNPNWSNISANGATLVPDVTVANSTLTAFINRCTWEATPSVNWLRVTPASGIGSPISATFTVDSNPMTSSRTGTITIGGVLYSITQLAGATDATPNPFLFTAAVQIPISTYVISNSIGVSGINVAVPVSIAGGGEYSVNGGAYSSAASTLNLGDIVTVRLVSSASYSTLTSTVLTIGGVSATFSVTTVSAPIATNGSCGSANGGVFASMPTTNLCLAGTATAVTGTGPWTWSCTGTNGGSTASCSAAAVDTTPDAFSFAAQSTVPLSASITSNMITVTGINSAAPISVVGGTYSVGCTATFTSATATISNGQNVCVRHTSSAANSTATTTTLTVGGVVGTFTSTTVAAVVNGLCGTANGSVVTTSPTTNLCSSGTATTVTGIGPWTWSCAGANGGSTATCGAVAVDTTPDAFSFASQIGVAVNSPITSNVVTITGINSPTPISVASGSYSVGCGGTFTSGAGTISNNQTVCVRHTSSAANGAAVTSTLTVGGVLGTFTSTTTNVVCSVDVVGSGTPLAVPDGLLLLRYMLGFRANGLTQGLSISGPRSAVADIEAFLSVSDYSATGTAGKPASIDGLIFLRLLQGVPDSALLSGINVPVGAAFRDAAAIRANVNARCGTAF